MWAQDHINLHAEAEPYVDEGLEVMSVDDALSGARDILAERVSEDGTARARLRALFARQGTLKSKVSKNSEESGVKYRDYFDWEEQLATAPSHRVLAMLRGEKVSLTATASRAASRAAAAACAWRLCRCACCCWPRVANCRSMWLCSSVTLLCRTICPSS